MCRYDFFARQEAVLGLHGSGVRCVEWLPDHRLLATGSWDHTLCCWDPRIPQVPLQHQDPAHGSQPGWKREPCAESWS